MPGTHEYLSHSETGAVVHSVSKKTGLTIDEFPEVSELCLSEDMGPGVGVFGSAYQGGSFFEVGVRAKNNPLLRSSFSNRTASLPGSQHKRQGSDCELEGELHSFFGMNRCCGAHNGMCQVFPNKKAVPKEYDRSCKGGLRHSPTQGVCMTSLVVTRDPASLLGRADPPTLCTGRVCVQFARWRTDQDAVPTR